MIIHIKSDLVFAVSWIKTKFCKQVAFLLKGLIKHLFMLAPFDGKTCEFQK